MLRWGPSEFWQSNVWQIKLAQEGYLLSKGVDPEKQQKRYPTMEEVKEAIAAKEARKLARMNGNG